MVKNAHRRVSDEITGYVIDDDDRCSMKTADERVEPAIARDPVCGELIATDKAAGKIFYLRKIYYFCCSDCLKQFIHLPHHFVS